MYNKVISRIEGELGNVEYDLVQRKIADVWWKILM